MKTFSYYEYYNFDGADFFTMVIKPAGEGKFPVVITRSPYVGRFKNMSEDELLEIFTKERTMWAERGYALVFQHCRGQGKSTGEFVPYVHERQDGIALRDWVRKQSFYNGKIFLWGGSYTASLHYSTAPFEDDVAGAVFDVQDCERYRLWYRNGQMRRGHANWHFELYKDKANLPKNFSMESFSQRPLAGLSKRVLGEQANDFEQMLLAHSFDHPFWQTRFGGNEARDAVRKADIPILLTTGYNDFYVGGIFKMWEEMSDTTREKSALIVSPYNHGQSYDFENGMEFEGASVACQFGQDYPIKWFDAILKNEKPFVSTGMVTYYRTFENRWQEDFYGGKCEFLELPLGEGVKSLVYNPDDAPLFNPEGVFMDLPNEKRNDIITLYSQPAKRDMFVKGKMKAKLAVASDCEDTSFYIMVGINTHRGDYALRHDITSISYQHKNYVKNEKTFLDFQFDEYAFALKKGQRLRIDIAPTDKGTYVCHTNIKGDYSTIDSVRVANNKVFLEQSFLTLPVEKTEEI